MAKDFIYKIGNNQALPSVDPNGTRVLLDEKNGKIKFLNSDGSISDLIANSSGQAENPTLEKTLINGNETGNNNILLKKNFSIITDIIELTLQKEIEVEIAPDFTIPATLSFFGTLNETVPIESVGFGIANIEPGLIGPDEINILQLFAPDGIQLPQFGDGTFEDFILTLNKRGIITPIDPSSLSASTNLSQVLSNGNVTDGNNINISSKDSIISTPLANENQQDVNIRFLSGRAYRLDFVPIEDIPVNALYVNPIGGNGTSLQLALYFNSSSELIDIKIVDSGYNYVIGDVVTILESESGIPDFTVTITETYGSVNNKGAVEWIFTGPSVSDGVGNSSLTIDNAVNLFGSRYVTIQTPNDTFLQITPDGTLIDVSGSQSFKVVNLPVFADNVAAVTAGLEVDRIYKTATGELRIVI